MRSGVLTGNDTRWRSASSGSPLPERTDFGPRSLQSNAFISSDRTATQYDRLLASSWRLSVRLSVSNAVHSGSQGRCSGLKVVAYQRVSSMTSSDTCRSVYCLATKCTGKKQSKKTRAWVLWDTGNHACTGLQRIYLLLRTWEERRRGLCSSRLSGLSLGAFIKSSRLNRIVRLFQTTVCSIVIRLPYVVYSTIGYHSNSWASCHKKTR